MTLAFAEELNHGVSCIAPLEPVNLQHSGNPCTPHGSRYVLMLGAGDSSLDSHALGVCEDVAKWWLLTGPWIFRSSSGHHWQGSWPSSHCTVSLGG